MMGIKKLEIGRKINSFEYGLDNTSRAMNMPRVTWRSKCMRLLREMIVHPRQMTQREIKRKVYGREMGLSSQGLFSALRHFGLAGFERHGRTCVWAPTIKGIMFYLGLPR